MERNTPITEKPKGKKRKGQEEDGKERRTTQGKRMSKREDKTKFEKKKGRRLERSMKRAEVWEVPDIGVEAESTGTLAAPEGVVWDDDHVYCSDEKGHRKKRKRKGNGFVRHES